MYVYLRRSGKNLLSVTPCSGLIMASGRAKRSTRLIRSRCCVSRACPHWSARLCAVRIFFFPLALSLSTPSFLGMSLRVLRTLGVLVLACCALVTSRSVSFTEPDQALDADGSHRAVAEEDADAIVGNCTRRSRLLYTERVAVLKDTTSLVHGTLKINVGQPIAIHCVRVVAKSESDRRALSGHKMLGTAAVEISIAEHPDFQAAALEYTVHVYGSFAPTKHA